MTDIPKKTDSASKYRDETLGTKIDHIAGVVGYMFPNGHFNNKALANGLDVNEAQMARKRVGKDPIDNQELCTLLNYCGLDGLTVDDLKADVEALKAALERERVGIHGAGDGDRLRRKWLGDTRRQHGQVSIQRLSARRAGMGSPVENKSTIPFLRVGELVRLVFSVPADGHILVLNDEYLRRDMTCLAPSCYAPTTRVAKGSVGVPFSGPDIEPAMTVLGPPGWCRIIVLWTERDLRFNGLPEQAAKRAPFSVGTHFLAEIDRALDRLRRGGEAYSILTGDYRVIE